MTSPAAMTEADLDAVYSHFCKTMTTLGEDRAKLFLARFSLLAMTRLVDERVVRELIDRAADMRDEGPR